MFCGKLGHQYECKFHKNGDGNISNHHNNDNQNRENTNYGNNK